MSTRGRLQRRRSRRAARQRRRRARGRVPHADAALRGLAPELHAHRHRCTLDGSGRRVLRSRRRSGRRLSGHERAARARRSPIASAPIWWRSWARSPVPGPDAAPAGGAMSRSRRRRRGLAARAACGLRRRSSIRRVAPAARARRAAPTRARCPTSRSTAPRSRRRTSRSPEPAASTRRPSATPSRAGPRRAAAPASSIPRAGASSAARPYNSASFDDAFRIGPALIGACRADLSNTRVLPDADVLVCDPDRHDPQPPRAGHRRRAELRPRDLPHPPAVRLRGPHRARSSSTSKLTNNGLGGWPALIIAQDPSPAPSFDWQERGSGPRNGIEIEFGTGWCNTPHTLEVDRLHVRRLRADRVTSRRSTATSRTR